jgi:hypothetical protein
VFTLEDWEQHKPPTIIVGRSIAEKIDPLSETWLAVEEILRQLPLNDGVICLDDKKEAVSCG